MFEAMAESADAFSVVCEVISDVWRNKKTTAELDIGESAILAKNL